MKKKIDIDNWSRKEHFHFFKTFEEPFFGVTATVDCTKAYNFCKENEYSFFLFYLHKTLVAVNSILALRLRIEGEYVYEYDQVNTASTVMRPDQTFGFCYMTYDADFVEFEKHATVRMKEVQSRIDLIPSEGEENIIHFSSLPWINFTSLSHARKYSRPDSCPKISFGKMTLNEGKREMPVSIHVNHALVDGLHVGQFIDKLQSLMNIQNDN